MIAISSLLATILLVQYFKKITSNYVSEGITIGLIWLAINILLDIIVLVPMAKMTFINYFSNIGLSYVMIPAMSIAVGFVSENAKTKK
jgi:Na+(H+)/acetate symporter ActP